MGRAIALDLLDSTEVEKVAVADLARQKLKDLQSEANNEKLSTRMIDVARESKLVDLIRKFDIVTNALPHSFSVAADRAAIRAGVSVVDLSFEDEHMQLDAAARKARVAVIPGSTRAHQHTDGLCIRAT